MLRRVLESEAFAIAALLVLAGVVAAGAAVWIANLR